jgi:uncharacterized protein YycO
MKKIRLISFYFFKPIIRLAGKINWRIGRPYKVRKDKLQEMKMKIKPGMVVLTHKEYELTNLFIPGYWTHSAMIVSKDEIVEAAGQGVMKKKLDDFFQSIDDFLLLEPCFCDRSAMQKASKFANQVIGYSYNYFFMPRDRSFFCTELIFNAYAYASGKQIPESYKLRKVWDFTGGESYLPKTLAELKQFWQVV